MTDLLVEEKIPRDVRVNQVTGLMLRDLKAKTKVPYGGLVEMAVRAYKEHIDKSISA